MQKEKSRPGLSFETFYFLSVSFPRDAQATCFQVIA